MTKADSRLKSESNTPTTMLTEVENQINSLFVEFDSYLKDDEDNFTNE